MVALVASLLDDPTSGVGNEGDDMFMHPDTHMWLQEQDRERAMTQHALERAARAGGSQRPGVVRGGISSFGRFVRRAASAAINVRPARTRPTAKLTGPAGV